MKVIDSIDAALHRRSLSRWDRLGVTVRDCDLRQVATIRKNAIDLRHRLERVLVDADSRLSMPHPSSAGPEAPHEADWSWCPDIFRKRLPDRGFVGVANGTPLGSELTVFHDCKTSEITVRQVEGIGKDNAAPFLVDLDVLEFDGSFLSLAWDLPSEAAAGLSLSHVIQIDLTVEHERPIELFARLNVKHGPNVEQAVRELDLQTDRVSAEIDLAYTEIVETQIERVWLDIIIGQPAMNRVVFSDLMVSRRLRAEL